MVEPMKPIGSYTSLIAAKLRRRVEVLENGAHGAAGNKEASTYTPAKVAAGRNVAAEKRPATGGEADGRARDVITGERRDIAGETEIQARVAPIERAREARQLRPAHAGPPELFKRKRFMTSVAMCARIGTSCMISSERSRPCMMVV